MYYEEVFKALNKNKIKYLVIGGIAVNLHGLHRFTKDLDLIIDLSNNNLIKFIDTIGKLGYKTNVPKHKWGKLAAIAFTGKDEEFDRVDIFLKNPIDFDKSYKKREIFKLGRINVSCISLEDLLFLKNKADRLRDWIDIGSLKRMKGLRKNK